MAGPFTETFTASDGTDVSSLTGWTKYSSSTSPKVYSNRMYGVDGGSAKIAYYNTAVANAHYAKVKLTDNLCGVDTGGLGPAIRVQSNANGAFHSFIDNSEKVFNGETIGTNTTDWDNGIENVTLNSVYELAVDPTNSTTIYARKDGETYAVYTSKSGQSNGYVGVAAWDGGSDGFGVDDWEGGDVTQGWFQQKISASPSGTQTGSVALTYDSAVQSGSLLVAFVCWSTGTDEALSSFSDSVNGAWTAGPSAHDSTNAEKLAIYYFKNSAAGTPTVTATFVANRSWNGLWIAELRGMDTTTQPDVSGTGQVQAGPGTTADAISSGATSGTATANAYCIGVTIDSSDSSNIAAGTAKVPGLGWDSGVGSRVEAWFEGAASSTATATFTDATNGGSHRYATAVLPFKLSQGTVTYQYADPNATLYNSDGWTKIGGGTTDPHLTVDEGGTPNDSDGVESPESPTSDVIVFGLSDLVEPGSDTGYRGSLRYKKSAAGGDTISLVAQWRKGYTNESSQGTLVATLLNNSNISDTITQVDYDLNGTEGAAVDPGDLVLRLVANKESSPSIVYVGSQKGGFAGKTGTTTVTFSLTGGTNSTPQAGDLVIVSYCVGSTADRALTIRNASSTDYTLIGSELYQNDTYDVNLRCAYRFMPATPETTCVLSGTGSIQDAGSYTIHVFRNVDTNTPLDVTAVTAGGVDTRLANPGAITPTTAGAIIYVVGAAACGTGGSYTASYLSGFQPQTNADTNDSMIGAGYVTWTSGQYDPAAFTGGGTDTTSDSWAAVTVALRPASTARKAQVTWARFRAPDPGSTPRTLTSSLSAAIQEARTLSASMNAAIQFSPTPITASMSAGIAVPATPITASLSAAVAQAFTATASLSGAVQVPQAISAGLSGAVQVGQAIQASMDAGVAAPQLLSANMDAAVGVARTVAASLSAAVQQALNVTTALDAAIQTSGSAQASVDAAIEQARTLSAELSAAVQVARNAQANLDGAVQFAPSMSADLDAAVQVARTAQASLDAYITVVSATFLTASMDAAVQEARSAQASVDAAVQEARSVQASLGAVVQVGGTAQASMDAAVSADRSAQASMDAAVQVGGAAQASIDAAVQMARSASATLDAAVSVAHAATLGMDAAVALFRSQNASLDAAIQVALSTASTMDCAIQVTRNMTTSLDAAIQTSGSLTTSLGAAVQTTSEAQAALDAAISTQRSIVVALDAYILSATTRVAMMDAAIQVYGTATAFFDAYIVWVEQAQGGGPDAPAPKARRAPRYVPRRYEIEDEDIELSARRYKVPTPIAKPVLPQREVQAQKQEPARVEPKPQAAVVQPDAGLVAQIAQVAEQKPEQGGRETRITPQQLAAITILLS